ncbi:MAG: hypothetical protein ABGW77_01495 [Campylobacterales bacterium]
MKRTIILLELEFFLREIEKHAQFPPTLFPPQQVRALLYLLNHHLHRHLQWKGERRELVRLIIYTPTLPNWRVRNPVTGEGIQLGETRQGELRQLLFRGLKTLPFSLIRWGKVARKNLRWRLNRGERLEEIVATGKRVQNLPREGWEWELESPQLPVMLGVDITKIGLNGEAESIILIGGGSGFIPAANLVRWEGLQFIWDPLWSEYDPELSQFVDLVRTPKILTYREFEEREKEQRGKEQLEPQSPPLSP